MCGIAGFFLNNDNHDLERSLFEETNLSMKHRGPDDNGFYLDSSNKLGLMHTRLSIIDKSQKGHQPMLSENNNVIIVFNGEIYNFKEIRKNLISKGYKFRSSSDTEVLLNLYLNFKEEGKSLVSMLKILNGIFSFAIWDKTIQKLIIAKDAFGVKPLYWRKINDGFIFGSELKSLQNISKYFITQEDPAKELINYKAIQSYLTYLWCPSPYTSHRDIYKLEPGNLIEIEKGLIKKKTKWYDLPQFKINEKTNINPQKKLFRSDHKVEEIIKQTRIKLRKAVHSQLVSDVPIGAFLSGGLDSSAIVAFAKEKVPNLKCFTINTKEGSDNGYEDDLPYAKKVAAQFKLPLFEIDLDSNTLISNFLRVIDSLEEPIADPSALNVLLISEIAREHGIKVLLSGAGGDDIFTGYRRHIALKFYNQINLLPNNLLKILSFTTSQLPQDQSLFRRLSKFSRFCTKKGEEALVDLFIWNQPEYMKKLFNQHFRNKLKTYSSEESLLKFLKGYEKNLNHLDEIDKVLCLEQRFFLSDHNLIYTDKMSMAAGVEVRVPFLDLDLVKFTSQIPSQLKLKDKECKWILKKAMEGILPREIIYRKKMGFGSPIRKWLKFELKELVMEVLSEKSINKRGIFSYERVQKLIEDNDKNRCDGSYAILSLISIEIWCRRFIDQRNLENLI